MNNSGKRASGRGPTDQGWTFLPAEPRIDTALSLFFQEVQMRPNVHLLLCESPPPELPLHLLKGVALQVCWGWSWALGLTFVLGTDSWSKGGSAMP